MPVKPDDQKPLEQLVKEHSEAVMTALQATTDGLTSVNEALKAHKEETDKRIEDILNKQTSKTQITQAEEEAALKALELQRKGLFIPPGDDAIGPAVATKQQLMATLKRRPVLYRRTGTGATTELDVLKVLDEDAWAFQKFNDLLYMGSVVMSAKDKCSFTDAVKSLTPVLMDHYLPFGSPLRKALDTATATEGAEWIPTMFSADLMEIVRLQLKVGALHSRIPMPSNPYTLPVEGADQVAFLTAQNTADPESATKISTRDFATANITLTAIKLAVRTAWSDELDADSIVTIGDYVRMKQGVALAAGQESAAISGDTTGTHMDADVTAATDARKSWDGYRDNSLNGNSCTKDAGGDALVLADLRAIRKSMGKYGINPADLAWITSISGYNQMLALTETTTVDKYGAMATVIRGELAKVDGIPIIVSEYQREGLNASGVQDGVTETLTGISLVNRNGFIYGDRLNISADAEKDITTDQIFMVTKQRLIMSRIFAVTEKVCGYIYNILT